MSEDKIGLSSYRLKDVDKYIKFLIDTWSLEAADMLNVLRSSYAEQKQRIEELEAKIERLESEPTYDDACETIDEGLNYLINALGIDGDAWGDDAAQDYVISQALKRMARDLEPMGIKPDEDEQILRLPSFFNAPKDNAVAQPHIKCARCDDAREINTAFLGTIPCPDCKAQQLDTEAS